MIIGITEFRMHAVKYFEKALNGEKVYITRGGVRYELVPKIPVRKQLQK